MSQSDIENAVLKKFSTGLPTLEKWATELNLRAEKHRRSAHTLRNINRLLGGLNVALAAVTATAMYAALNKKLEI